MFIRRILSFHRLFYLILRIGGELFVSVPDVDLIFDMLRRPSLTRFQKNTLLSILFGGQDNLYNFHKIGFYYDFLNEMLLSFGFCDIIRVENFELFQDTSGMVLDFFGKREPFSLNVKARRCPNVDPKAFNCHCFACENTFHNI